VDDLSAVVQTNLANRSAAVGAAEKLVDAGVAEFAAWQEARATFVPKIQALNEQAKEWQEQEIERARKQFLTGGDVSQANIDKALQALARNLSNKFLHLAYKNL